jgi:hypothetical protein
VCFVSCFERIGGEKKPAGETKITEVHTHKTQEKPPLNSETNGLHPETRLINSVTGRSPLNPEIPLDQTTNLSLNFPFANKRSKAQTCDTSLSAKRGVSPAGPGFVPIWYDRRRAVFDGAVPRIAGFRRGWRTALPVT